MNFRAPSICAAGAGQMISPDSSRSEGVRWYSGTSARGFFALVVAFNAVEAARFMTVVW